MNSTGAAAFTAATTSAGSTTPATTTEDTEARYVSLCTHPEVVFINTVNITRTEDMSAQVSDLHVSGDKVEGKSCSEVEQTPELQMTEPKVPQVALDTHEPEMTEREPEEENETCSVESANEDLKTENEISLKQEKLQESADSEGLLNFGVVKSAVDKVKSAVGGVKSAVGGVAGGVKNAVGEAISFFNRDSRIVVYSKKVSIHLPPRGRGVKTYCRLVTYKPTDCYEPLITLTITPSKRCHHDNTHLFVRFAGYNSK